MQETHAVAVADNIPSDQKISAELELVDDLEFLFDPRAGFGIIASISLLEALLGEPGQQLDVSGSASSIMPPIFWRLEVILEPAVGHEAFGILDDLLKFPIFFQQVSPWQHNIRNAAAVVFGKPGKYDVRIDRAKNSVQLIFLWCPVCHGLQHDHPVPKGIPFFVVEQRQLFRAHADELTIPQFLGKGVHCIYHKGIFKIRRLQGQGRAVKIMGSPEAVYFRQPLRISCQGYITELSGIAELHAYNGMDSGFPTGFYKIIDARYGIDVRQGHGLYAIMGSLGYKFFERNGAEP